MIGSTTSIDQLGPDAHNQGCNFGTIWDACTSPVYLVLDEDGNNPGDARIRHLQGNYWLYMDDQDGYSVLDGKHYQYLILSPEEV